MRRFLMPTALALLIGWVYFLSSAGIVSTNDGSHLALTRALTETRSASIDHYVQYTARDDLGEIPPREAYLDLSYFGGHFYSDRAPGTAILAVPFFAAGLLLLRLGIIGPAGLEYSATILPALAGAVLFLAVYGLARELGGRAGPSTLAALLVAFGTLMWKYSTVLYSHAVSAALVAGAAYLAVRWARSGSTGRWNWPVAATGLLLGLSVLVDYVNVLLFVPFAVYLLWVRGGVADWGRALAGALPPVATLALYNYLNFGSPLASSYTYHYHFEWARSLSTTYSGSMMEGLRFFVLGQEGVFAVSPFLLLSLIGLATLLRRRRPETALLLGIPATLLLAMSMHKTYFGGGTGDTRYVMAAVPLLAVPLVVWLEGLAGSKSAVYQAVCWAVLAVAGAFSILRSFVSLQTMFGHVAAERSWQEALEAVLQSPSLELLFPRLEDSNIYLLYAVFAGLLIAGSVFGRRRIVSALRRPTQLQWGIILAACLLLITGFSWYQRAEANWGFESRENALLAAGCNLLSNPGFESSGGSGSLGGWKTTGTVLLATQGRASGHSAVLDPGTGMLETPLVYVRGGEQHRLSWYARGEGVYAMDLVWENDERQPVAVNSYTQEADGDWRIGDLVSVAPLDATGVRARFSAQSGRLFVDDVRLSQTGVRVEPIRDFGRAALAFSFDWETAMGGAIHSKGAAEPSFAGATEHGLRMRQGAENLLRLFDTYGVKATFYATGYNLLDGNTARRAFAGNPTYDWARPEDRWASDFWLTHPWYMHDPFGTYETHPAWYFGDLVDRMLEDGQDVQTHTFGHLYVRGTSPEELAVDLDEWNEAAADRGLGPARAFAFPWRSSNSVKIPHLQVLADRGMVAITRLYEYKNVFELDSVGTNPPLLVYPDRELEPATESRRQALETIDELLAKRGFTSLWTHPGEVTGDRAVGIWDEVIAYAVAKRKEGLVVDSLTSIIDHYLAVRKLKVDYSQSGNEVAIAVKNTGETGLEGATLTLPGLVAKATTRAGDPLEYRHDQVLLPPLGPGVGLEIVAILEY